MVGFVNKLKLSDQKYHTNGNVRDENYNEKLLFPMKDFVPFVTYFQSMYFMSTRFLKDKVNEFRIPQFQIFYILNTTHTSHKNLVQLCQVKVVVI